MTQEVVLKQLSPPEVFGLVESGIYRSNSLHPVNFPFIKLLRLKTVLQLSPEVPIRPVISFFEENNIKHVSYYISVTFVMLFLFCSVA